MAAAIGRERIGRLHWLGAVALDCRHLLRRRSRRERSAAERSSATLIMLGAVACWSVYTIGGGRLMSRHSPLFVTGVTMAIGTIPYALLALPTLLRLDWSDVSPTVWLILFPSGLSALNFAFLVWYTAVQRLGPARTSIYSNASPACRHGDGGDLAG